MMPPASMQHGLYPEITLTRGERLAWAEREPVSVDDWALNNRVVEHGPWKGEWRDEHTPYLVFPMWAASLPFVRELVVVGPGQAGKTQILYNAWGWAIQSRQSEMAILLHPDQNLAEKICEERLQKLVHKTPCLAELVTGRNQDINKKRIRLTGHTTFMAWAGSESTTEAFSAEFVGVDEPDAIKGYKPGDRLNSPISRARTRAQTFTHTGKVVVTGKTSSLDAPAWMAFEDCGVTLAHGITCPDCGNWQVPNPEQLKWPKGADPDRVEAEHLAHYQCEFCGRELSKLDIRRACRIPEEHRETLRLMIDGSTPLNFMRAARLCSYRPVAWDREAWWFKELPVEDLPQRPPKVGIHFSAFVSPFVPLSEIAAQAIRAQSDSEADHTLHNRYLAIPYQHVAAAKSEDHVLRLCDHRPPGQVPELASVLTAVVDVQRTGFWFTLRAWRPGPDLSSWLVRYGYRLTWGAVEKVLFKDVYRYPNGETLPVAFGLIDSGDGSRTVEIYKWCQAHPPFYPSKGDSQPTRPWTHKLSEAPMAQYGVPLVLINTAHQKNELMRRLAIDPGQPGAWNLHTNFESPPLEGSRTPGLLDDYARQLCAETLVEGKWTQIPGRANHLLDCEAGQLVAADVLGIRFAEPEPAPEPTPHTETQGPKVLRPDAGRAKTFLQNRRQ